MWKWLASWVSASRGRETTDQISAERPPATVTRSPGPRLPGHCRSLHDYLDHRFADVVVLTFGQVEDLLGVKLPESARIRAEWWTSTDPDATTPSYADAWVHAGRTARPNLLAQTVVFERVSP